MLYVAQSRIVIMVRLANVRSALLERPASSIVLIIGFVMFIFGAVTVSHLSSTDMSMGTTFAFTGLFIVILTIWYERILR